MVKTPRCWHFWRYRHVWWSTSRKQSVQMCVKCRRRWLVRKIRTRRNKVS